MNCSRLNPSLHLLVLISVASLLLLASPFPPNFSIPRLLKPVNSTSKSKQGNSAPRGHSLSRRDALATASIYGGIPVRPIIAANTTTPNLSSCSPNNTGYFDLNCCPPKSEEIEDFKLNSSGPLRTRPAAHLVDAAYLEKYKTAVRRMKALPLDDPRSFLQQANAHCAYCNYAYKQLGKGDTPYQIHFCWLFFPFHRWFLYFYERILGKLIDDPTFALPFWNWDAPEGMEMPSIFVEKGSPLYNQNRAQKHITPRVMDLNFMPGDPDPDVVDCIKQMRINLITMYRQMVSGAKTTGLFMGHVYKAGDPPEPGAGTIEQIPHNTVHKWTGDTRQPLLEDMGMFYTAARDPIFFAHHANIDRLWTIWKTLGGKRQDYSDPDWLQSSFLFYNEEKKLVRVTVEQCLDPTVLGYQYQKVDVPWVNARPKPRWPGGGGSKPRRGNVKPASEVLPAVLNQTVSFEVARPQKSRSKEEKEEAEEMLLLEDIQLDGYDAVKFDVYVNDDEESPSGPENTEFAGSFVNIHHSHKMADKTRTSLSLGITDIIDDLQADDDDTVVITLVPRYGGEHVIVGAAKIVIGLDLSPKQALK